MNDEEKQKDSIGSKLKQAGKEEAKNKVKSVAKKLFIKAIPFIDIFPTLQQLQVLL